MNFLVRLILPIVFSISAGSATSQRRGAVTARSVVDSAIAHMGGLSVLRGIRTVKYDIAIQWLNPSFDARPYIDAPSYELDADYRDYDARIWRNARRFPKGSSWLEYLDLVIDTVAARRGPNLSRSIPTPAGVVDGWAPLDIAYIDERRELFALTPDRLVLELEDSRNLAMRADTVIGGIRHWAVTGSAEGYPITAFFRQTDGLLTLARYHADESNDFGLAPWGPMNVEVWYSLWGYDPSARVYMPFEWDIVRVGRAYKRISVLGVAFDSTMTADSLTLAAPVRDAYLRYARKPMADLPLDSARLTSDGRMATFGSPGAPRAAVKVGSAWLLLEPGNLPLNAERAAAWLAEHDAGSRVAGAIIGREWPSGGAAWIARNKLPIYAAPSAEAGLKVSMANYGAPLSAIHTIATGQWIRPSGAAHDSLWAEPVDFPNAPRSLLLYVPSMRWVYSSGLSGKLALEIVKRRIAERGWSIDRIGTVQAPVGTT